MGLGFERQLPAFGGFRGIRRTEHDEARNGAECCELLHRLVGGAIFAEADRVMRQHMDDADAHQRGEADRRAAIIREDQEAAAIGDETAMQRNAVHCGGHAVLADAVMHVAAGEIGRSDRLHLAGLGVVGGRQVGRTADRLR
jgi:hypothetical protein